MVKRASECERCRAWKKILSQTLGSSSAESLESLVEKELASQEEKA